MASLVSASVLTVKTKTHQLYRKDFPPVSKKSSLFHHKCYQVFVWLAEFLSWSDFFTTALLTESIWKVLLVTDGIHVVLNYCK